MNNFKINEGPLDRIFRFVLGILFFILFFFIQVGFWGIFLLVGSIILIVTAFTGFCGIYSILGINTLKSFVKSTPKTKVNKRKK